MDTSRIRRNRTLQPNKHLILFHIYGIREPGGKIVYAPNKAREMGKIMAQRVANKLKLNLDVKQ